jgi:transketolase
MGTRLQGHPASHLTPGIEGCTGSLGQGLSFANGMALATQLQGLNARVYCLVGDGELQEGQVWEAAMTAPKHCLTQMTVIVDQNGLKAMDETVCGKPMEPLAPRWSAFGWDVREIDGHNMEEICDALDWAAARTEAPAAIMARTTKGKGISFIENQPGYHNYFLTAEQFAQATAELEANLAQIKQEAA